MSGWQRSTLAAALAAVPSGSHVRPYGSFPAALDAWSDLDLEITLEDDWHLEALDGALPWAWQKSGAPTGADAQIVRLVLEDGRRIDVRAMALRTGGQGIVMPEAAVDNDVRFDAALASARLGRGDRLIGTHLALGIAREILVLGMERRDRDEGTRAHRHGTSHDALAAEVCAVIAGFGTERSNDDTRPTAVERLAQLYGEQRAGLDPDYRTDWSGLGAVIDRGRGIR